MKNQNALINEILSDVSNPWVQQQKEAEKLAKKWAKYGLLENLNTSAEKNNMALILENQGKQLLVEASQTGTGASFTSGTGENWAGIALPLIRKIFGKISAKEFVSVQPMTLSSGLAFFLDFQFGTTKTPFTQGESVYGITSGSGDPTQGLYGTGRFTYSTNNTSSVVAATTGSASWTTFNLDANFSASAATYKTVTVTLPALADANAVRGFFFTSASGAAGVAASDVLNQFTTVSPNGSNWNVTFVVTGSKNIIPTSNVTVQYQLQPVDNRRGDFELGNTATNAANSSTNFSIPEFNISMRSEPLTAKTKKLKASWTPEFSQDLNAYQSLDAEKEISGLMGEYVSLEIDLELYEMLVENAPTVEYWSAVNNRAVQGVPGAEILNPNLGFYNSQGQWFQTLGTKISKVSNAVHQKTLRGGCNLMMISPKVATVIEAIPGYASGATNDPTKDGYAFGTQKSGTFNSNMTVFKNPYMNENLILLAYKGSQFLESGAVYAPYIPLIMTPLVYDPNTYQPSKGLLTRFAKKMLRPEFYGKIYIDGLNTL